MRVAVVGAGSWGTAVAALLAGGHDALLWARSPDLAAQITGTHLNVSYLPGIPLPERLRATADLSEAVDGAEVVVMAVPSHGFRDVLARVPLRDEVPVVSLTKGIETGTLARMSEVVAEVFPRRDPSRTAVLTGPNLAREVALGQPTASVIACTDADLAVELQHLCMTSTFRVYTNPDLVGCEVAGALKNVMAIAAGIADGLGYGDNTKAALITRGLAELARLGVALGGDPLTFSGLAGMGDLVATCTSEKSRNRAVGVALGRGRALADVVAEMRMVAEGVKTARAVLELAARHGVEMPIAEQVGAVLDGVRRPQDIVPALMLREAKPELRGIR